MLDPPKFMADLPSLLNSSVISVSHLQNQVLEITSEKIILF